jgi:hypothetical protein
MPDESKGWLIGVGIVAVLGILAGVLILAGRAKGAGGGGGGGRGGGGGGATTTEITNCELKAILYPSAYLFQGYGNLIEKVSKSPLQGKVIKLQVDYGNGYQTIVEGKTDSNGFVNLALFGEYILPQRMRLYFEGDATYGSAECVKQF